MCRLYAIYEGVSLQCGHLTLQPCWADLYQHLPLRTRMPSLACLCLPFASAEPTYGCCCGMSCGFLRRVCLWWHSWEQTWCCVGESILVVNTVKQCLTSLGSVSLLCMDNHSCPRTGLSHFLCMSFPGVIQWSGLIVLSTLLRLRRSPWQPVEKLWLEPSIAVVVALSWQQLSTTWASCLDVPDLVQFHSWCLWKFPGLSWALV